MQPKVVFDHFSHEAIDGTTRPNDEMQNGGAALLILDRALKRLDLAPHASDPV